MVKKIKNPEIIEKLLYGLPDSRISKVAQKITVVSDKGTKIVIKDRDNSGEEVPVFLYKPLKYKDLDSVVRDLEQKEVVVTSAVFRNKEVRKLLSEI